MAKWNFQEEKIRLLMEALRMQRPKQLAHVFRVHETTVRRWINGYNGPDHIAFGTAIYNWAGIDLNDLGVDVISCGVDEFKDIICNPLKDINLYKNPHDTSKIGDILAYGTIIDEKIKELGPEFVYLQPTFRDNKLLFMILPFVVIETNTKYLTFEFKNRLSSLDTAVLIVYQEAWCLILIDAARQRPSRYTLFEPPIDDANIFLGTTVSVDRFNIPGNQIYSSQVLFFPTQISIENFCQTEDYFIDKDSEIGKKLEDLFSIGIRNTANDPEVKYFSENRHDQIKIARELSYYINDNPPPYSY